GELAVGLFPAGVEILQRLPVPRGLPLGPCHIEQSTPRTPSGSPGRLPERNETAGKRVRDLQKGVAPLPFRTPSREDAEGIPTCDEVDATGGGATRAKKASGPAPVVDLKFAGTRRSVHSAATSPAGSRAMLL